MATKRFHLNLDGVRHAAQAARAAFRKRWRSLALLLGLAPLILLGMAASRCRMIEPPSSAILLDRHGVFLAQLDGGAAGDHGYWPLDHVPDRVAAATLAIEDQRFWQEPGVDPLAMLRAAAQNLRAGMHRSGASTIAMQLARLQNPEPRSYLSKMIEAATALMLTARYGHAAILRQYLRLAPYGQGSHGIAHAARWYFNKPIDDLSWGEIAFLTAIPQAPGLMNPASFHGHARIVARGSRILARLAALHIITADEQRVADSELPQMQIMPRHRPQGSLHSILRIAAMRRAGLLETASASDQILHATLDRDLQTMIAAQAHEALAEWRQDGAEQLAIVVADRRSREVRASFGSAGYFLPPAGAMDFTHRLRSPGSTLKPFIYALGLDQGTITPASVLEDLPDNRGGVSNADRSYLGALLPAQALANSRNIPATNLVRMIGIDPVFQMFQDLRLTGNRHAAYYYGLVMAIGALPTRLDALVAAYGALANDGEMRDLVWVKGQSVPPPSQVMSEYAARQVTLFLSDPLTRLPSFPRMGSTEYRFPVAVKTGTSQGYRDAWAVAYSRRYIVGVWVGRSNAGSMNGLSGGRSAARLAQNLLGKLQPEDSDGLSDINFAAPAKSISRPLCIYDGSADAAGCAGRLIGWFPPQASIVATSTVQPALHDDTPVRLSITAPDDGARFIRNPEQPDALNWIPLHAALTGIAGQILWLVDGRPFATAAPDEDVRWPLTPGTHKIEAQLAFGTRKAAITIGVE